MHIPTAAALILILSVSVAQAIETCDTDVSSEQTSRLMELTQQSVVATRKLRESMREEDALAALRLIRERRALIPQMNANLLACAISTIDGGNKILEADRGFEAFLRRMFPSINGR